MLAAGVILLFCEISFAETLCLDSDISYVRKLDAAKQTSIESFQVFVNASDVVGVMKPFWKSTGFCPPEPHNDPEFFLGDDMQQNLIYIAAIPGYGTTQVRMHWLLDIVNARYVDPRSHLSYRRSYLLIFRFGLQRSFKCLRYVLTQCSSENKAGT
ncbi:hypothetical protein V5799_030734 [Amblyomma americanum]|uniref:Secreted protein n=1 Tax=Amblyomma americanum TaxID=6943 RepID=A0AAQ4EMH1_AMBAM